MPQWSLTTLAVAALLATHAGAAERRVVVAAGRPTAVEYVGAAWTETAGGLTAEGVGRFLYAGRGLGTGDFHLTARLTLARLDGTAASFVLDGSHLGFDGRGRHLFSEGPLFGGATRTLGVSEDWLRPGQPFAFEAIRQAGTTRFVIDGREVLRREHWDGPVARLGFRPQRNRMTVEEFTLSGNLTAPPSAPRPLGTPVFIGGQFGYDTYRIPALAVSNAGTVLAVCEGRQHSDSDSGDIDLLLRRSGDHGRTWSDQQVIWDDGANTCGNPCLVVDRDTGVIWLLATWNRGDDHEPAIIDQTSHDTRRVFVSHSDDDGLTWAKPSEITAAVKQPQWTWCATGPGSGIQLQHGAHRGRLVIPCDHIEAGTKRYLSHVVYSDDHGATWQLGGTSPRDRVNECEVVELSDGRLLLNMRNYDRSKHSRQVAFSDDGGETWRDQRFDQTLVEPTCQAAVDRVGDVLLFSNPADAADRVRLTVRASFDDGASWPRSHLLYAGPSGYSDLAILANGEVGCLYECGVARSTEDIVFARLALDALQ